ncbi:amino acid ABC transporter permease [Brenneria izadpanahii]|uniref:Amino acid ABC transporter permease n=1 Tax=Brenneria izadpanahii TaxID=2722756 RepID=A0ABX7UUC8_9GAMM|nr:amino acid ABC transporter permease [Brenneria izadpanahii]QTF08491.1 amino acid ABC transporter permease [Brenneria izadpanahii]
MYSGPLLDSFLSGLVAFFKPLGLNYAFVLDPVDRAAFLSGMGVSLELCLLTIPFSLLMGVLIAAALTGQTRWLTAPVSAFVELVRNTPTLVQLYCAFLVLNMLITQHISQGGNPISPLMWVVLVVSVHKAVFHAEALRAGIEAVSPVTLEAARAMAFSRRQIFWYVQLPLAVRFSLPALVNNLVDLVKMTAIASAIAVGDVTYQSIMIWSQRDNVLELILLILVYFAVLTWLVSAAGRWLENRLRMPGYGQ